ncbi:Inosine-uridine preferring nucleoside hydrolase [Micrococcus lylae]|uniref:Inosine-uridine preferring nucleoside hydrolase n=1 Tax=Micrococcus lylae TaxID=1273 RepID=A0A1R4JXH9_9MICC|nr:Inosine-uridine preferring nucleoside hydrolase [Micrococcus lylae]
MLVVSRRILADVDTGIDDACALIQLAGCGAELAAVTTTGGNATARECALNTLGMLELLGLGHVEVAVGAEAPLRRPPETTPETHGEGGIGYARVPHLPERLSGRSAVEVWVEELRAHPGETTILCTAPLTNLALALRAEPRLPELAAGIVIMGGSFYYPGNTTPTAEWNTWVDPDAAKQVYATFEGLPEDRLPLVCSLETTERIEYTPALLDGLLEDAGGRPVWWSVDRPRQDGPVADTGLPVLDVLADALRFYFEFHHDYDQGYVAHLHDLFAAQAAAGVADYSTATTVVDVEADSDLLRGTTVHDDRHIWGRRPNARRVTGNDPSAVFSAFAQAAAVAVERSVGSS